MCIVILDYWDGSAPPLKHSAWGEALGASGYFWQCESPRPQNKAPHGGPSLLRRNQSRQDMWTHLLVELKRKFGLFQDISWLKGLSSELTSKIRPERSTNRTRTCSQTPACSIGELQSHQMCGELIESRGVGEILVHANS